MKIFHLITDDKNNLLLFTELRAFLDYITINTVQTAAGREITVWNGVTNILTATTNIIFPVDVKISTW